MKKKFINNIISNKINEWLSSLPEEIQDVVRNKIIVTGGAITSLLLNEKVNDFDVYFRDKSSCMTVAKYYIELFKQLPSRKDKNNVDIYINNNYDDRIKIVVQSAGIANSEGEDGYRYFEGDIDPGSENAASEYVEKITEILSLENEKNAKYIPIFISSNAITLSGKIQLIVRFFGEPEQIHDNYDYVHCTNYWTSWDNHVVFNPKALECIINKELIYNGSNYPICSLMRMRKFINRGWTINAGQILKMVFQVNSMDLNNIYVLEDQLTGVDSAYFYEILSIIKRKQEEEKCKDIDSTYLMEIIDKVF